MAAPAITGLDGRYASKVVELGPIVSEFGLMKYRLQAMCAWVVFLHDRSLLPDNCKVGKIKKLAKRFSKVDYKAIKAIEAKTNHDVKAVEYFIRSKVAKRLHPWIHFACTSEDVNNVAYAMMLRDARAVVQSELQAGVLASLTDMAHAWKAVPMLSRTHGQTATPTTVGKELAVFAHRLRLLAEEFDRTPLSAKWSGATGNFAAHMAAFPDVDWVAYSRRFVTEYLELEWNPLTTQIESHDMQAIMLNQLSQLGAVMIDLSRDMWQYISLGYFGQKVVAGEVGSSTMPHKVNPIDFENGEGNLKMMRGLAGVLAAELPISRMQRDLSDSTMQRNFGTVFGYYLLALKSIKRGLGKVELRQKKLLKDLRKNPEVLTEAIQTVLRRNGHADAYEQLKQLSRGRRLKRRHIRQFIAALEIHPDDKDRLLELDPAGYVGASVRLVEEYLPLVA